MNLRTESFDFPQKEQRRCLSLDMKPLRDGGGRVPVKCPRVFRASSLLAVGMRYQLLLRREYAVDDAVRLGLFGAHEPVAVHVPLDRLDRLAGVEGIEG